MTRQLTCLVVVVLGGSLFATTPAQEDEKTLLAGQVADDGPALLKYFRSRTVSEASQERMRKLIALLGDDAYTVREQASADIVANGITAVGLLRKEMSNKDVEIARRAEKCLAEIEKVPSAALSEAAARTVARRKPAGAATVLLAYLPFADDESVADEVREGLAVMALKEGRPDPALLAALGDSLPLRRGAAGEALVRAGVPEARKLMSDPDLDVRLRVTLALVAQAKDKTAVSPLINLLAELPAYQGWRVEETLLRLAGDAAPAVSLGKSAADHQHCRDAWAEWWAGAAAKTDLKKLDVMPRMLGNTLVVWQNLRNIVGGVYEIGPDKHVVWRIDNLQLPVDAIVMGKDQVLIAEYLASQVSLRDFRGNVIWSKTVREPVGLQALPGGHVLVSTRRQLIEWNEKHSEVFTYLRDKVDIAAACKDKRGDYWIYTTNSTCVRVDRTKKEGKSFATETANYYGGAAIEPLPNGRLLIAHLNGVSEFDINGKKTGWTATVSGHPTSIQRLPNGNTLLAGLNARSVAEVDRHGKIVWDYKSSDDIAMKKARRR